MKRKESSTKALISKVAEALGIDEYCVHCTVRQIEDPDATNHLDVLEMLDLYKKGDTDIKKNKQRKVKRPN